MAFENELFYVEVIISNPTINSLKVFVDEYLILLDDDFTINDLYNYESNFSRIKIPYTPLQEKENSGKGSDSLLKVNTIIRVPKNRVRKEIIPMLGNIAVPIEDFNAFLAERIKNIVQHEGYRPIVTQEKYAENTFLGNAYRIYNNVNVWIYSKGLGQNSSGKLVNVTPFVQNVSTNVSSNGGNFSISLSPVTCIYDEKNGWIIDENSMTRYYHNNKENITFRDSILRHKDGQLRRKQFYFHNILKSNDVVFIQFETLEMERNLRNVDDASIYSANILFPEIKEIHGKVYDMIGLIDSNSIDYNAPITDLDIHISGRDLMKVLLEDGCYIYPIDYGRGFSDTQGGSAVKRVLNRDLYFFKAFTDTTLDYLLSFLFNALSNISITRTDDLFMFYDEERKTHRYELRESFVGDKKPSFAPLADELSGDTINSNSDVLKVEASGIWKIIKLAIDDKISDLRVVDRSIADFQGSLLNYVNKVCEKPFVEFYGDTYGDEYYFIARRPPFTQKSFLSSFDDTGKISISEDDIEEENLNTDDSEVISWYRLRPQGSMVEQKLSDLLATELTIFFEEYAQIWGSKSMDITTNYCNISNKGKEGEVIEQMRQDLAYLIETTAYLPFVRKGTIKLTKGNRRIKRGLVIRHEGTQELFHVDSVSHSYSVSEGSNNRSTTVQVSRGMLEKYARGTIIDGVKHSYFDIIDLKKNSLGESQAISSNFKLRGEVFNFFLKGKQFI